MKVYIFMIKAFFVKDGIDTAMAVDNTFTKVFKRTIWPGDKIRWKNNFLEEQGNSEDWYRQKVFDSHKEIDELVGIYLSDWFTNAYFEIKRKDGSRVVFEIIEKELCWVRKL